MHDMTLFTLCQYQARHLLQMRSSPLTSSPSVWQIDEKIGFIYLHVSTRFIFSSSREIFIGGYLQTILHPCDPWSRIKCDGKLRSIFPCSLRAKQNKNCPPRPRLSALSCHLAFHRFTQQFSAIKDRMANNDIIFIPVWYPALALVTWPDVSHDNIFSAAKKSFRKWSTDCPGAYNYAIL